jgi:hypothetical protein
METQKMQHFLILGLTGEVRGTNLSCRFQVYKWEKGNDETAF